MSKAATKESVTQSQFAKLMGWYPSYVTKLKQAGRLVFTPNGKRVLVDASEARIEETKDPNRDDVAGRHAKNRKGDTTKPNAAQQKVNASYTKSRANKEYYASETAKIEHQKLVGELCEIAGVHHAGGEAGVMVRTVLENLPDQLAPMLAPITDEGRLRALLVEHIEIVLHELSDRISGTVTKLMGDDS